MNRLAILVPYSENQNEPSIPIKQVFTVTDDKQANEAALTKLFWEHVCSTDDPSATLTFSYPTKKDRYGDIVVSYDDADCYLFVTYLEQ
jgi:hypothetical protein